MSAQRKKSASAVQKEASSAEIVSGGFSNTLIGILSAAIEDHKAGNLEAAEAGYRKSLEMAPDHPHALHYLGVMEHQRNNHGAAIELIDRAIENLPEFPEAFSNLGAAHFALRNLAAAETSFRRAAELNPNLSEAHSNLGAVLMERDKKPEALESYKKANKTAPGNTKFVKRLGDLCLQAENYEDAAGWFKNYLEREADNGEVNNNLGYALERLNRLEEAAVHYQNAIDLCPSLPEINNNLGTVLGRLGRHEEANALLAKAVDMDPSSWQDLSNLAGTYVNRLEPQRAIPIYEKLIEKDPENAKLINDYGVALSSAGRIFDAEEPYKRAIEIDPDFAEAYNNLGSNILLQGRRPEAIEHFKKAIEIKPDYLGPHINVCHTLSQERRLDEAYMYAQAAIMMQDYVPAKFSNPNKVFRATCAFDDLELLGDPWENMELTNAADYSTNFLEMLVVAETPEEVQRLARLHKEWGQDVLKRLTWEPLPPLPQRPPGGKIKLGIISSDLRHHSVAKFVLPVLEHYDRDRFEIHCYAPFDAPNDDIQTKIKGLVSAFKIIENISDREYAEIIRDDKIDILFELNGFTRDSRLKVLAYKPAPVQVGWLGYPFTTGVAEIDYFVLDDYVRPTSDDLMVETPICLPDSFVCFDRFPEEPISETPPFDRNGFITFGSLNNPYKVTRQAIEIWSQIMNRVPGSRFLYVRPELGSMVLCNNIVNEFGRHGIGPDRIYFVNNWKSGINHFSFYDEIDISLDTFPLTGGTTTCDSLWMGVPLISKIGPGMHQRLSYSIMSNAGLQELCVQTNEEYVDLAASLALEPESLRLLRNELRPALNASALCKPEEYALNFCNLMADIAGRHGLL